jgi:hypothetical protein
MTLLLGSSHGREIGPMLQENLGTKFDRQCGLLKSKGEDRGLVKPRQASISLVQNIICCHIHNPKHLPTANSELHPKSKPVTTQQKFAPEIVQLIHLCIIFYIYYILIFNILLILIFYSLQFNIILIYCKYIDIVNMGPYR